MIYQGDSFSFTLFLGRSETSVVNIISATQSGGSTTYKYTLQSGPQLKVGNSIVVAGFITQTADNGTFTIDSLDVVTDSLGFYEAYTFTVTNVGVTSTEANCTGTVGTTPNVTSSPVLQIIKLSDLSAVLGSPAAMTALDGTKQLWVYNWDTSGIDSGEYVAVVSYAADGDTFSGKPIEKIQVGDSRILGTVALDSTVAKNATVAKDATVAKSTDIAAVDPNTSSIVLAIKAKTDNLPSDPAGITLLSDVISDVADIHDAVLGSQTVDKTQNPAIFQLKRLDNSVLATYELADTSTETSKTKV